MIINNHRANRTTDISEERLDRGECATQRVPLHSFAHNTAGAELFRTGLGRERKKRERER